MRQFKATLAVLLLTGTLVPFALTGCGSRQGGAGAADSNFAAAPAEESMPSSAAADSDGFAIASESDAADAVSGTEKTSIVPEGVEAAEPSASTERKLVTTYHYDVETEDFDSLIQYVEAQTKSLGGYVEDSSINGATYHDEEFLPDDSARTHRTGYYTLRIPADKAESFAKDIEGRTNVLSQDTSVEDITLQYVDTDARRESLEEEQQRLNAMLKKAETVDEMIQIEQALENVRYQLNDIKSQLKVYDNQVNYSTINLTIEEVVNYTPVVTKSTQQRITDGFFKNLDLTLHGLKEFGIWIVVHSPQIIVFIIVLWIIIAILRRVGTHGKRKAARIAKKQQKAAARANKKAGVKNGAKGDSAIEGSITAGTGTTNNTAAETGAATTVSAGTDAENSTGANPAAGAASDADTESKTGEQLLREAGERMMATTPQEPDQKDHQ